VSIHSVVLGTGSALPKRRVTNDELAQTVDTTDQWIVERTGIRARYVAGEGETTASLATDAARKALDRLPPSITFTEFRSYGVYIETHSAVGNLGSIASLIGTGE